MFNRSKMQTLDKSRLKSRRYKNKSRKDENQNQNERIIDMDVDRDTVCMYPKCRKNRLKKYETNITSYEQVICPNCQTFYYCSSACAEHDAGFHRSSTACIKIGELRQEAESLKQTTDVMSMLQQQHLFVGRIQEREYRPQFAYLRSRMNVALCLKREFAEKYPIPKHWHEINFIIQENLRMCHLHLLPAQVTKWCLEFAKCLLHSGRIDDALSFSLYVIRRFRKSNNHVAAARGKNTDTLHLKSKEGHWIYPRDIKVSMNDMQHGNFDLVFTVYLAKLKRLMGLTKIKQKMKSFRLTSLYQRIDGLDGPFGIILEYLIPSLDFEVSTWENVLMQWNELVREVLNITDILHIRSPQLFHEIQGLKGRNANEINDKTIQRFLPTLRSIPDLEIWFNFWFDRRRPRS